MVIKKGRCLQCGHVMRIPAADPWPDYCGACGQYIGVDESFVPTQMNIGTPGGRAADTFFKQEMAASEARAELAGDPSLKVTDMKDGNRPGDVSGKKVENAITQFASEMKHDFYQGSVGQSLSQAQQSGATPRHGPGEAALAAIQGGRMRQAPPAMTSVGGMPSGWGGAPAAAKP